MGMPSRYDAAATERRWQDTWAHERRYEFSQDDQRPIFAIDTPPPTVSGELHIGHVYSYVQAEAMARFWRMQGYNVYYPFGFDDNGLPTERYVERQRGMRAREVGRAPFIAACLELSSQVEDRFEQFWKRLGMSVDWRMRYSTIDPNARRAAQWSFIDLYQRGLVYRAAAPNPWCVECQTAIAQADMDDAERATTFYTLAFPLADAPTTALPIATTRPELLPACVAIMVHPSDPRYAALVGRQACLPLFDRPVTIMADPAVDPQKGSGAVMCCTFGDTTDVAWWRTHGLPLIELVAADGRLTAAGGRYAGLSLAAARTQILADLAAAPGPDGLPLLREQRAASQSVRTHERCGTPLEIRQTSQWFIRILDARPALLEAGRKITWRPAHMRARYEHWVSNLNWDWSISRQRFFGVPFPVWHCQDCGAVLLAEQQQLPIDPATSAPPHACACGSSALQPDPDVMDTWATSSLSPQIAARMFDDPQLYARLFPMQLRPQAHDIIRTWAFYTIVKSHYHFGSIPWETILISGHALDPSGHSIHKSKGNSPIAPAALIERYGADAVRYWACGGGPGVDQPLNEGELRQGQRLITKLWNAARFIGGQLADFDPTAPPPAPLPADRALWAWQQQLITQASERFRAYDYAGAREAIERFFWGTLCDHYLEWVKARLYDTSGEPRRAAQWALYHALRTVITLLAPIMPHITEEIHAQLFAAHSGLPSIHVADWPQPDPAPLDPADERLGAALLALTGYVRRFKSAHQLSLGSELAHLTVAVADPALRQALAESELDLRSVSRARALTLLEHPAPSAEPIEPGLWGEIEGPRG